MIDFNNKRFSIGIILSLSIAWASAALAGNFKEDYDRAYKSFEAAKSKTEITKVAENFSRLSERKDAGKLLANTFYWQGACWYRLGDYVRSLQKFEKVLTYPLSYKEEAARYKVAACYMRLKDFETARWEYNRFLRDFPQSKLAGTVRTALAKIDNK